MATVNLKALRSAAFAGKHFKEVIQKPKFVEIIRKRSDDLYRKAMVMKLSDITPNPIFSATPCAENKWALPRKDLPHDLPHRIMSFLDQQTAAIDPRAMCKHFVEHKSNPIRLSTYDAMIGRMLKYGQVVRESKEVDGKRYFFYRTAGHSKAAFRRRSAYLNRKGESVPPVEQCEVTTQTILNA